MVEHWTHDLKAVGLIPSRSDGRIFFLLDQLSVQVNIL